MAGFPPARGGGSPFMALLGGLGAAMQGFMQGREFKQSMADDRALQQERQLKNASEALPLYAQLSQTTPALRTDPNFIAGANKNLAPLGVNFRGQVPDTFGSVDPTQLLTNPGFMTWYSAQPRESQQMISQKFGGALPVGDAVDTSPTSQWHFDQMVSQNLNNLGKGEGLTPEAYINWVKTTAPRYGRDPSQYLSDPSTIGQLSQVSEARINNMVQAGLLKQTTADALKAKLPYQIKQMIAGTNLSQTKANAIPVQLQQGQERLDNESKKLDLGFQNLQARMQQIAVSQQNATTNTLRQAETTHHDAIIQWQSDQRLRQGYIGQLNAYVSAKGQLDPHDPIVNKLTEQINNLTHRIGGEQQFISNFPKMKADMQNKVLHNGGAPNNMKIVPQNAGHSSTPAGLMNGKPIFLKNDKSGYVYADGTPVQ